MHDLLYDRIYRFLSDSQKRAVVAVEQFALGSIVGSVRDRNEDVAVIVNFRHARTPDRDYILSMVCDGMGGMADGRQAALIAASTFVSRMLRADRFSSPSERLRSALTAAQRDVLEELRGKGGTTLSALYLDRAAQGWLVHVGDSRVYAITTDGALRQISRDDTIGAALNRDNEKRSDFNRLIQFIGVDGDLDPQVLPISRVDYNGFLLTSDGAHSVPSEILSTVVHHAKSPPELVRKLLSLADALGGLDNATVVYVPSDSCATPSGHARGEVGAQVRFLCLSGEHDIWITHLDAYDREHTQRERGPVSDERASDRHSDPAPQPKARGMKRRRKAKSQPEAQSYDEFPLKVEKPKAKLDFSDDGEAKS